MGTRRREPRAVVAGAGHSGTRYLAKVLGLCGVKAGHEAYYNPYNLESLGLDVDVAWPSTVILKDFDGIVWHQVRDPLATVSSLAMSNDWVGPYWQLRKPLMPKKTGSYVLDAMNIYLVFNREAEKYAEKRWRVEDIDVPLVAELITKLGYEPDLDLVEQVLSQVSKQTNKHNMADTVLRWQDLPYGGVRDELRRMAAKYGYRYKDRLLV